ncbi:P-loop NTPase fold protein [Clostridium baratii]|uniref:P-loop NTPase fold protein n=1 Tax=Clostridium baratii TaxID=1561 RepID=UPI003D331426
MKEYIKALNNIYGIISMIKKSIIFIILILILDNLNIVINFFENELHMVIAILVIIFILVQVYESNIINGFKLKIINYIDEIILYALIMSFILSISYFLLYKSITSYKVCLSNLVFILIMLIFLIRLFVYSKDNNKEEVHTNVYDLKDLYEGNIGNGNRLVLINEEDVCYDLLGRDNIIENIYNTTVNSNPENKFVISLEGPWGSGKTTLLNIVSKKIKENNNDIIVINDFEPWAYNDQCSMFRGMFDTILRCSGAKYSISKSSKLIDELYELLFDTKYSKGIKGLNLFKKDSGYEIGKIKEMINSYLVSENKKIVFIIDNIDRATKENINLIFRLISTVFNFKRVTYILSFDDERVKRMLEHEIGFEYEYLKKVIQMQVKVPVINNNIKKNIIKQSINNLLVAYGEKEENLNKYKEALDKLSEFIKDIRDFKRFLNSVITFSCNSNGHLNIVDLIVMEFIKGSNNTLYKSISENSKYYISYDIEFDEDSIGYIFNMDKLNIETKEYFDETFHEDDNKKYLDILAEIFPNIKLYSENNLLREGYKNIDKIERNLIISEARICSAKYFDLYFTHTKNEFIEIRDCIEELVQNINSSNNIKEVCSYIDELVFKYQHAWHKVLFETLELYIGKVDPKKLLDLSIGLFNNINKINDSLIFMGVNAKSRASLIIANTVLEISEDEFDIFLENIKSRFDRLTVINMIYNYLNHDRNHNTNIIKERSLKLSKLHKEMSKFIYNKNIDLYDKYYACGNIWGLYHAIKDEEGYDIKNYMNAILNSKNVIRFIYDMVEKSVGTKYSYCFREENMELFTSKEILIQLLENRSINTSDEEFVVKLFNKFINNRTDSFRENIAIDLESEIKLNL